MTSKLVGYQAAWDGIFALFEHCPAGDVWAQMRATGVSDQLFQLAEVAYSPALQECAIRGLAAFHTNGIDISQTKGVTLIPLLLRMMNSHGFFSDAASGIALEFLKGIISFGIFNTVAMVNGAIPQLITVLQSRETRPEHLALANACLEGLLRSIVSLRGKGLVSLRGKSLESLTAIARLADISPAAASEALHELAMLVHYDAPLDAEFRRLEVPLALVAGIRAARTRAAAARHAERARRASAALCFFAARSAENAKAVFRQCGMPVLVKVQATARAQDDRGAAAEGLRIMEASGGPLVHTAIREARERLDARLASALKKPRGVDSNAELPVNALLQQNDQACMHSRARIMEKRVSSL